MIKIEDMTDGLYYVKEKHGVEVGDWDSDHKIWNGIWGGDDTEVLAPVPSYEELQNMNKAVNECMAANIKLVEENKQLKELLKECELWFTGIVGNMNDKNVGEHNRKLPIGNFEYIFTVFSQKINEVLK